MEEKGIWSTNTLAQVFIMLQLGQDMAPCQIQASESHFDIITTTLKAYHLHSQDKYSHYTKSIFLASETNTREHSYSISR